jgi:hypothetical protein
VSALLLSTDLLWSQKIVATARALGHEVRVVKSLAALAAGPDVRCVILDLCAPGIDAAAACARVPGTRVVAFGRHTDVAGLDAARAAGCDPVLARSQLQAKLAETLADWLGQSENTRTGTSKQNPA